tara:strand:+ start:180 stop:419 length:240 start_codon:yes stop_codon:yes gene_type:complete
MASKEETERERDERLLRLAIDLSHLAVKNGNHPFGALLAKDGNAPSIQTYLDTFISYQGPFIYIYIFQNFFYRSYKIVQ